LYWESNVIRIYNMSNALRCTPSSLSTLSTSYISCSKPLKQNRENTQREEYLQSVEKTLEVIHNYLDPAKSDHRV
jgi:hypothetical protein